MFCQKFNLPTIRNSTAGAENVDCISDLISVEFLHTSCYAHRLSCFLGHRHCDFVFAYWQHKGLNLNAAYTVSIRNKRSAWNFLPITRRNEFESVGTHVRREAPENFLLCPFTFLALQVQLLVVNGERFGDGQHSLVIVSCLLFFYSRCHPAICKSGGTCPPPFPVPYGVGATLTATHSQAFLNIFSFQALARTPACIQRTSFQSSSYSISQICVAPLQFSTSVQCTCLRSQVESVFAHGTQIYCVDDLAICCLHSTVEVTNRPRVVRVRSRDASVSSVSTASHCGQLVSVTGALRNRHSAVGCHRLRRGDRCRSRCAVRECSTWTIVSERGGGEGRRQRSDSERRALRLTADGAAEQSVTERATVAIRHDIVQYRIDGWTHVV